MKLKNFLSTTLLIAFGFVSTAHSVNIFFESSKPLPKEKYVSGKSFCQKFSNQISNGESRFITARKDVNSLKNEELKIYTWSVGHPFDPNLPSVIEISGGPGLNVHSPSAKDFPELLPNWNLIVYDMRGVGCSAPDFYDEFIQGNLYSYENLVNDVEEIRKSYGLDQVSIYGVSFGTVVGTIYAHKYPQNVRALVLEGVVSSEETMENKAHLKDKITAIYIGLSKKAQNLVDAFFKLDKSYYFGTYLIYEHFGRENASQNAIDFFEKAAKTPAGLNTLDEHFKNYFQVAETAPSMIDNRVYWMTSCQNNTFENITFEIPTLKNQKIEWHAWDNKSAGQIKKEICGSINMTPTPVKSYHSVQHPLQVSVTYFQGTEDHLTELGAIEHFNHTATAKAQLLLKNGGGHLSNIENLRKNNPTQAALFEKALKGEEIEQALVDQYNLNTTLKWQLQKKGF